MLDETSNKVSDQELSFEQRNASSSLDDKDCLPPPPKAIRLDDDDVAKNGKGPEQAQEIKEKVEAPSHEINSSKENESQVDLKSILNPNSPTYPYFEKCLEDPCNLYIDNLPSETTQQTLENGLLSKYIGKDIASIELNLVDDRCNAVVKFNKVREAIDAMNHINSLSEKSKDEKPISAGPEPSEESVNLIPSDSEMSIFHIDASKSLWLYNLRKDVTANKLKKYFYKYGPVQSLSLRHDKIQPYGLVSFDSIETNIKAMRGLLGESAKESLGPLHMNFGPTKVASTLLIANIPGPCEISAYEFRRLLSNYGYLGYLFLDWDHFQALAFYSTVSTARHALKNLRGKLLKGYKIMADYATSSNEKAYLKKLPERFLTLDGTYSVLSNRTFDIQNNFLRETDIYQQKRRHTEKEQTYDLEEVMRWHSMKDAEDKESIDPLQLIEIPGFGLYFIKSSHP